MSMLSIDKRTEIAHDLLMIHQERVMFYRQIGQLVEHDEHFSNCIKKICNQCTDFIIELRPFAGLRSVDPADYSDIRGDIYHNWRMQGLAPGCKHADMICTCEENEKATTAAYELALVEEHAIGRTLRHLFSRQLQMILESLSILQSHKKPPVPVPANEEKKFFVSWGTRS